MPRVNDHSNPYIESTTVLSDKCGACIVIVSSEVCILCNKLDKERLFLNSGNISAGVVCCDLDVTALLGGGDIRHAKDHHNVIQPYFFEITLDQVSTPQVHTFTFMHMSELITLLHANDSRYPHLDITSVSGLTTVFYPARKCVTAGLLARSSKSGYIDWSWPFISDTHPRSAGETSIEGNGRKPGERGRSARGITNMVQYPSGGC